MAKCYDETFLISGVMCYEGCAKNIKEALSAVCPDGMELFVHPEPDPSGQMRIRVVIDALTEVSINTAEIDQQIKDKIHTLGFAWGKNENTVRGEHQRSIAVGIGTFLGITLVYLLFPPSLLITLSLSLASMLSTAWMAREKLRLFFQQWRSVNLWSMEGVITLGWVLSALHTLYHIVSMPLIMGFSMVFMGYLMPVLLFTLLSGMDEFKRRLIETSAGMRLDSLEALFPGLNKTYNTTEKNNIHWFALKEGMYIHVPTNAAFPVDGKLESQDGCIDESSVTGEPTKRIEKTYFIKSGTINKGKEAIIHATKDPYDSFACKLLFDTHRETHPQKIMLQKQETFLRTYGWLVGIAVVVAIAAPFLAGTATVPLLLQSITSILFSVCPCTAALAFELPPLFSMYQRHRNGVTARDTTFFEHSHAMDTIIFDKTGTLTTGISEVGATYGSALSQSKGLLQRIRLLEETFGGGHPIAKAIIKYCPKTAYDLIPGIEHIGEGMPHGGLIGKVQGRKLAIGNYAFVRACCDDFNAEDLNRPEIKNGDTPVFVAENGKYKGVMFIRHEVSEHMIAWVKRLYAEKKRLILLTGDTKEATEAFLKQQKLERVFNECHSGLTPWDKKDKVDAFMPKNDKHNAGVWMIGDGANELQAFNLVSERGGVACAIGEDTPARFRADLCLSRDCATYPEYYEALNDGYKRYIDNNQTIVLTSTLFYASCVIGASIMGVGIPAIVGVLIMMTTTGAVLLNSQRVIADVDKRMYDCRTGYYAGRSYDNADSIGSMLDLSSSAVALTPVSRISTEVEKYLNPHPHPDQLDQESSFSPSLV